MVFKRIHDEDDASSDENQSRDAAEFAAMLDDSFSQKTRKAKLGDAIQSEILRITPEHVIVSAPGFNDAVIDIIDFLDAEGNVVGKTGDKVTLYLRTIKGDEVTLTRSAKPGKGSADSLADAYARQIAIEGKVEEAVNGGFSVTIQGKRAFCPISQLDSKHVEGGEEFLGKKFYFRITKYSEGGRNLVVSRKALLNEERKANEQSFFESIKVGAQITGTVSRFEKFGAFVEVAPGVEGLVHISEIAYSRVNHPSQVLEIGQQVSCNVLKIESDGQRKKISLSIKQCAPEPWTQFPTQITEGAVVKGRVTRCLKFGAFVEVAPGIEGLIPLSEMSYTKRVSKSDELFKEDEVINVKIKEIDSFARKLLLSFKEAEGQDPWSLADSAYKVGSIVNGKVEKREAFGLFVQIAEGVRGLLPKRKALEVTEFGYDKLKIGDEVTLRVSEINPVDRKITLEVPFQNEAEENWKSFKAEQKTQSPAPSLGFGLLGSQLKDAFSKAPQKK